MLTLARADFLLRLAERVPRCRRGHRCRGQGGVDADANANAKGGKADPKAAKGAPVEEAPTTVGAAGVARCRRPPRQGERRRRCSARRGAAAAARRWRRRRAGGATCTDAGGARGRLCAGLRGGASRRRSRCAAGCRATRCHCATRWAAHSPGDGRRSVQARPRQRSHCYCPPYSRARCTG